MTEIRCKKCNRLLHKAKGEITKSTHGLAMETKCGKCGYTNIYTLTMGGNWKAIEYRAEPTPLG